MCFVIYHKSTFKRLSLGRQESFPTERVAKGILTKYLNRTHGQLAAAFRKDYTVASYDAWVAADPLVETFSIHDLKKEKPVMIRQSEKGGCTDVGTERYWTM